MFICENMIFRYKLSTLEIILSSWTTRSSVVKPINTSLKNGSSILTYLIRVDTLSRLVSWRIRRKPSGWSMQKSDFLFFRAMRSSIFLDVEISEMASSIHDFSRYIVNWRGTKLTSRSFLKIPMISVWLWKRRKRWWELKSALFEKSPEKSSSRENIWSSRQDVIIFVPFVSRSRHEVGTSGDRWRRSSKRFEHLSRVGAKKLYLLGSISALGDQKVRITSETRSLSNSSKQSSKRPHSNDSVYHHSVSNLWQTDSSNSGKIREYVPMSTSRYSLDRRLYWGWCIATTMASKYAKCWRSFEHRNEKIAWSSIYEQILSSDFLAKLIPIMAIRKVSSEIFR